jgi:type IV secretion system protein VirB9
LSARAYKAKGASAITDPLPLLAASALAVALAQPANAGGKIREERYDPDSVYTIQTAIGCVTLVELEKGEVVDPSSNGGIGMGDAQAWGMAVAGNRIFFKPTKDSPQTNLIVATDRRTYVFDLQYLSSKASCPSLNGATYVLRFSYPETVLRKTPEQLRKEAALEEAKAKPVSINTNYTWRGSSVALKPTAAWDDGRFTRLQYDNAAELPQFYKVLPDGAEALINKSLDIEDPTIVVLHELARTVRVRLGNDVIEIANRGYTPPAFNRLGAGFPGTLRDPGNGASESGHAAPTERPTSVSSATPAPALLVPIAQATPVSATQNLPVARSPGVDFVVPADVQTVRGLARRWAEAAKLQLNWSSDVDYSLTRPMRSIEAPNLDAAIALLGSSLKGVRRPLAITLDPAGLTVASSVQTAAVEAPTIDAASNRSPASQAATRPRTSGEWLVGENKSLRSIVETWAATAGYSVLWKSTFDIAVTLAVQKARYVGPFKQALGELSRAFGDFKHPLRMTFSEENTERPALLVLDE